MIDLILAEVVPNWRLRGILAAVDVRGDCRSKHVAVADHRLSASLARIPARVGEIGVHVQTHYVTQRTVVSLRSVGDLALGSLEGVWTGMYARPEEGREISQNYPCFLI